MTLFKVSSREFIFGEEGIFIGTWQDLGGDRHAPVVSGSYLGRLIDGEYMIGVSIEQLSTSISTYEIYEVFPDGDLNEAPLFSKEDCSGRQLVADPSDGGGWFIGYWTYAPYGLYLNRFSFPWIPMSEEGFDLDIPLPSPITSPRWFVNENQTVDLLIRTDYSLRLMKFDSRGVSQSERYGKELIRKPHRLTVSLKLNKIGNCFITATPDTQSEEPHVIAFDEEGDQIWDWSLEEEPLWSTFAYEIYAEPNEGVAVLAMIRYNSRARLWQPRLFWFDVESGNLIGTWNGEESYTFSMSNGDVNCWGIYQNQSFFFGSQDGDDSLTVNRFSTHGEPIWRNALKYDTKYVNNLLPWNDGIVACMNGWRTIAAMRPWILPISQDGLARDPIYIYEAEAEGEHMIGTTAIWLVSNDRLWYVPIGPPFNEGNDSAGIQMIDTNGRLYCGGMGTSIRNHAGLIAYAGWHALPDSIGGIWLFTDHWFNGPREYHLFHITDEGIFDPEWPEEGIVSAGDSTFLFSGWTQSVRGGDVMLLGSDGLPNDYTEQSYYQLQRLSLNQSAQAREGNFDQPFDFRLDQPYPNPFNDRVSISFSIPEKGKVELSLFDLNGRELDIIYSREAQAGRNYLSWSGKTASSGLYFLRLKAEEKVMFRKIVMIK